MKLKTLKSRLPTLGSRLKTVNPSSWREGKTTNERGYTYRWQQARLRFLRANPLCAYCRKEGRIEPATIVDHILPHRGDEAVFWDEANWQALCKPHHDGLKAREEAQEARKL